MNFRKFFTTFFFGVLFLLLVVGIESTTSMINGDLIFAWKSEKREQKLAQKLAVVESQLAECNGSIPDGPEYHRGFMDDELSKKLETLHQKENAENPVKSKQNKKFI